MRKTQVVLSALLLVLLGSFAGVIGVAQAATPPRTGIIRVAQGGTDAGDCGEVAKPCANIWFAINLAGDDTTRLYAGAEIRVAAGTYKHRGGFEQFSVLHLPFNGSLKINGGYNTSNWDTSNPSANPTIIDGENKFRGISIVPLNQTGACNIGIDGFTITNGLASRALFDGPVGGGIVVNNGCTATLSNLIVKNNRADGSVAGTTVTRQFGLGGGIAIQGISSGAYTCVTPTKVTLTNVTLDSNVAQAGVLNAADVANKVNGDANGGGMHVSCGTITASNIVASNNTTQGSSTGGGYGGGISIIISPAFTLSNIRTFQNKVVGLALPGEGGGLFVERSVGTANIVSARSNTVSGNYAFGGGVYTINNPAPGFTLTNADISQNSATGTGTSTSDFSIGGGLGLNAGGVDGAASPVTNNFTGSNIIIAGNTIASPSATFGAGISCFNTNINLNNITVAANTMSGNNTGFGEQLGLINGCTGRVSNSIVSKGAQDKPVFANSLVGALAFDTNLINATTPFDDGSNKITKTRILSGDPLFVSATDFHLAAGSPAIDQATAASAATNDIDGEARTAPADLGADEYSTAEVRGSADIPEQISTSSQTISLTWTAPAGRFVDYYQISYEPVTLQARAVAAPTVITVPASQLSYVIRGLTTEGTYTVTITAIGVTGVPVGTSGASRVEVEVPPLTFIFLPLATR